MPWFHQKSDDEKQSETANQARLVEQEREKEQSLAALQAGGIPLQAQRRLDELRQGGTNFFSSDLSVNEFLVTRHSDFFPITQVMGSSVYHVGWQSMPGQTWRLWTQSDELGTISRAYNNARSLAIGRLAEEAQRAGAHAVVGVRISRAAYDWSEDMIEFNAIGTAVRWKDAPPTEHPYLTNLSGQDFWKLYQSGFWPAGIVAGTTVFYVVGGWLANMSSMGWGARQNLEIPEFSAGVSLARHRALGHVYDQARGLDAEGVVGMEIEHEQEEHEVDLGNDQERKDMIFTFHCIGTAITRLEGSHPIPSPITVVGLDT